MQLHHVGLVLIFVEQNLGESIDHSAESTSISFGIAWAFLRIHIGGETDSRSGVFRLCLFCSGDEPEEVFLRRLAAGS
jgi:hypothetical protein